MTDKDLRNFNRKELLELLVRQEKENQRLRTALNVADQEAENREISIQNAGSIAEAALQLTAVFEEAERAADIYLENVKRCSEEQDAVYDRIVEKAQMEAARIIEEAEVKADRMIQDAQTETERVIAEAEEKKQRILREADQYRQDSSTRTDRFYHSQNSYQGTGRTGAAQPLYYEYDARREAQDEFVRSRSYPKKHVAEEYADRLENTARPFAKGKKVIPDDLILYDDEVYDRNFYELREDTRYRVR